MDYERTNSVNYNLVGNNIRVLRQKADDMTQAELAKRIGVDRSLIACFENATKKPTPDRLGQLAQVFDVLVDDLLYAKFI